MWSRAPATNRTVAVSESASASEVSIAPKTAFSTVLSTTLKLTRPRVSDGPLAADGTALPPPVRLTDLPKTGLPYASLSVTVSVDAVEPSAVAEPGEAEKVEALAETPAGATEIAGVVSLCEPSPALTVCGPALVSVTLKASVPAVWVVPAGVSVIDAAGPGSKVTVVELAIELAPSLPVTLAVPEAVEVS